jgi:hypothetical protein
MPLLIVIINIFNFVVLACLARKRNPRKLASASPLAHGSCQSQLSRSNVVEAFDVVESVLDHGKPFPSFE